MNFIIENFDFSNQFFIIAAAHLLAVISPGPDFIVVIKQSVKRGRKSAILTSIGIAAGILIHVLYSLIGISFLIESNLFLFNALKFTGALYLAYIGVKSFYQKNNFINDDDNYNNFSGNKISNSFLLGFITNVFNPKATLFFLSLFTVVIDANTPIFVKIFYGFWMSSITGLWFLFVSFIFTSSLSKIFISRFSGLIDKIMGFILIIISVKILLF